MISLPLKIEKIKFFAKGKRSLIYTGLYKNKKVAIKIKNPKSKAQNRIRNEAKYLKILNKYNIGPKLIKSDKDYLIYEFVEGKNYIDIISQNKEKAKTISKEILKICRKLDKLKINKLEFTRPIKHIFVKNNKVTVIDFERAYKTKHPKNVTQFCQFLIRKDLLDKSAINLLKKYKKNQTEANFKKILALIK
jgi:predicted Ser/Thr protein kinase